MKQTKLITFTGETHFATALAQHILLEYYDATNPTSLAHLTVMLPTRRACQSLKNQLFQMRLFQASDANLILPKLTTISDIKLLDFLPITHPFWQNPPQQIITKQQRLFAIARHLLNISNTQPQFFNASLNFAGALEYAQSFLALRDDFLRTKITIAHLHTAIMQSSTTADYAAHWLKSLELFQQIMQWLDAKLEAEQMVEAISHQQSITDALCKYWQESPHQHPIIAAGSTGSAINTANLLCAIHAQPFGCIILRELDIWSDDADFNQATPTSANYNLRMLLSKLNATRSDVEIIPSGQSKRGEVASIMLHQRNKLHDNNITNHDLRGIEWLECDNETIEAQAICLKVRHFLSENCLSESHINNKTRNIIIISDDDALNMRLKTMLNSHNIKVDISAGIAAHHHPQFNFMLLVAEVLFGEYKSANLLALMRHVICIKHHPNMQQLADFMEHQMLRSMHPYRTLNDVLAAVMTQDLPMELHNELCDTLEIINKIKHLTQNITATTQYQTMQLKTMMELHQQVWLILNPDTNDERSNAGALLQQNLQLISDDITCAKCEYLSILQQQCAPMREISPPIDAHVTIIGLLELRLQVADLLIVARMNEGVFPSSPPLDPWLNNELRNRLGLNYFERKIGLSSHDMAIMLRFDNVLFTRSNKELGAHTRSSRLFERLKLLMQKHDIAPATYLLEWLKHSQQVKYQPIESAIINPPLAMRPRSISATMCESLFENPFKVYVSHILKLRELDPLDDEMQPKYFGKILHAALHQAARDYNQPYYLEQLAKLFEEQLKILVPASQAQFHHAKLNRILGGYRHIEQSRKSSIKKLETEAKYSIPFMLEGGLSIELTARIDRIEWLKNGKINIIDHKTGTTPSNSQITSFEKCQLYIAQLIMDNIAQTELLEYWDASGKLNNPSDISRPINAIPSVDIANKLYDCLSYFICDENAIYDYSLPKNKQYVGAIDHLARFGEYY